MVEHARVTSLLANAYEALRGVDLDTASLMLEKALAVDYENSEVLFAMKCAGYWQDAETRLTGVANPFERGELVLGIWKTFSTFQSRLQGAFEPCRYAFKQYCFSLALAQYRALPSEEGDSNLGELALRIGRCLKGAGSYDEALAELSVATKERRDDPEALAELADVHGLVNEMRESKALFREAFYMGPHRIALDFLESEMIKRLVEKVREAGKTGSEVAEWIPVYANLLGVFTVKRELKYVEAAKLRQSIYQLENELRENATDRILIIPRLVNRYFWLIDHCMAAHEDRARIDEILLKLRLLDPQIHKLYTA
jgi:tetratricopeptide (TPR) repeat protein